MMMMMMVMMMMMMMMMMLMMMMMMMIMMMMMVMEQGRHLGAGLGESEDVVDEEQHILVLLVSEVLSDGETGETDTGTGTWWLVHLTVHEAALEPGPSTLMTPESIIS